MTSEQDCTYVRMAYAAIVRNKSEIAIEFAVLERVQCHQSEVTLGRVTILVSIQLTYLVPFAAKSGHVENVKSFLRGTNVE